MALHAIRRAHALGAKTIIERGSSHSLTQQQWLTEEYDRYGVTLRPTSQPALDKALQEYAETDYVSVPSEFAHQSFLEHGYDARKLILNPFGVDIDRFRPGAGDGGQARAVFVGQVSLRKGIQYVLEAWRKLRWPHGELTIIGPIMPDAEKVIAPYKNDPSIRWVGFVNNLEDYLGRQSFFVFPSIEEGSALVTYIAMACGLPLITTFNAGSVARDGQEGYLVPVRDVEALGQRMETLCRAPELRRALGQAARQRVEAFSWPRYQQRIVALYQRHFFPASFVPAPLP
jgi:glycosyltransferase involved in cell wall biosynthesis